MRTNRRYPYLVLGWLLALLPAESLLGVGMDAQRIVVRRSTAALPPDLAPFFESRVADLEERVIEPDGVWRRDRRLRGREHWGHLWLDVRAAGRSVSARLSAAESFPRGESEAKELFKSMGLEKQGGRLPWAVADIHAQLVRAFKQGDEDEIIRAAGYLAHFAWAASEPFGVTMHHDGRETGNLCLGELAVGDPYFPHQSVHYRVVAELVRRFRNRYLEQVQVRPIELRPISEPLESCFRQMVGALARLDDLLTADREITERLGARDGASLVKREDEYYELLDARCGDIIVERMQSAAMLTAGLIAGAYERAGHPALGRPHTPTASPAPTPPQAKRSDVPQEKPATTDEAGTAKYAGSRKSKVFHRPDCPHVKRINPANLVYYESVEEAKRQGKRPCRVCKPE